MLRTTPEKRLGIALVAEQAELLHLCLPDELFHLHLDDLRHQAGVSADA
jgi:hypothetical protein